MTYPPGKRCPCGTGLAYEECCNRYHAGNAAPTAETLMRSRYSAFVTGNEHYLLTTWDPATRPAKLNLKDTSVRFYRLDVLSVVGGGLFDDAGSVEFAAHYKGSESGCQRETSQFRRGTDGRWYYSDGTVS